MLTYLLTTYYLLQKHYYQQTIFVPNGTGINMTNLFKQFLSSFAIASDHLFVCSNFYSNCVTYLELSTVVKIVPLLLKYFLIAWLMAKVAAFK